MTEINVVNLDFDTQYGAGWTDTDGYIGVYEHRGLAYLTGEAWNSGTVGTHVLTVPPRFMPAAAVRFEVPVDYGGTTDPATPGVDLPVTPYGATLNTDGTLVLDSLPPYANAAPDPSIYNHWDPTSANPSSPKLPDFAGPLTTTLLLSNLSWVPAADSATDDADAAYVSAASYLAGGDFEDVDSQIAAHDARIHLAGHVRAKVNNASTLATFPATYTQAIPADGSAHLPVAGPHDTFAAQVYKGGECLVYPDTVADSTPTATPTWPPDAPGQTWWTAPTFTGLWNGRVFNASTQQSRFVRDYYLPGTVPDLLSPTTWNFGNNFGPCGLDAFFSPIMCPSLGSAGSFTDSVDRFLQRYFPLPDWFMVNVFVSHGQPNSPDGNRVPQINKGVNSCVNDIQGLAGQNNCGPFVSTGTLVLGASTSFNLVDRTGAQRPTIANPIDDPTRAHQDFDNSIQGWVQRTLGGYTENPSNAASSLLWAPGELDDFTVTLNGLSNSGSLYIQFQVFPFWNQRRRVILAGDVIDLTNTGWQGLYTTPPLPPTPPDLIPSTVGFGPAQHGLLTRRPVLGVTSQLAVGSSGRYSMGGLVRLAAMLNFGDNTPTAAAVAMAESNGDPFAEGVNTDGSRDRGLWQINSVAWPDVTDQCAFTPFCNGQQAYRISYGGTNWTPWSTYNNGAFQAHLPDAQAAYAALQQGSSSQFASSQHGLLFH